jgi:hypothetical protein
LPYSHKSFSLRMLRLAVQRLTTVDNRFAAQIGSKTGVLPTREVVGPAALPGGVAVAALCRIGTPFPRSNERTKSYRVMEQYTPLLHRGVYCSVTRIGTGVCTVAVYRCVPLRHSSLTLNP